MESFFFCCCCFLLLSLQSLLANFLFHHFEHFYKTFSFLTFAILYCIFLSTLLAASRVTRENVKQTISFSLTKTHVSVYAFLIQISKMFLIACQLVCLLNTDDHSILFLFSDRRSFHFLSLARIWHFLFFIIFRKSTIDLITGTVFEFRKQLFNSFACVFFFLIILTSYHRLNKYAAYDCRQFIKIRLILSSSQRGLKEATSRIAH